MTPLRRAVPVAAVLAVLPATAMAALPNIDTWQGKVKHRKSTFVSVYHDRSVAKAQYTVSVTCKAADGTSQSLQLAGSARIKHGRLKLTNRKAYNGTQPGVLKIDARFPVGGKAKGKVSWKLPASVADGCKGSGRFTGKYVLTHGG